MTFGRTRVFGHRGASAYAPMNTIPAFELAAEQKADGIELDVHRSKDGHAVVIHDFTVDNTTNGRGWVAGMTLAELKALDAGGWFEANQLFADVRIPTLAEVFEAVGGRLLINVEIKSDSSETDGIEQVVADVITQFDMGDRVIVSSFNPLSLQRFRAFMPDVPIGFLYTPETDAHSILRQLNLPVEAHHPYESMVESSYMQGVKGYQINAWTVNDPARAVVLRDLGVDGIITDAPDMILKALRGE